MDRHTSFTGYASWWRHSFDRRFYTVLLRNFWTHELEGCRAVVDDFGNLVAVGS